MNSIISWVGGKKALRDLIYLRMPKNYDRYIEVFGGGGWVLFGKPPDKCMEVYNDFNSNLGVGFGTNSSSAYLRRFFPFPCFALLFHIFLSQFQPDDP